mgnify:CR=1 FL=1
MASELRVNTLKDAAGANSVAMEYVAGGSAKAWVNFNGTGTIAERDSLNVSSLADDGTGLYTVTLSNAMDNANYCINSGARVTNNLRCLASLRYNFTQTTSAIQLNTYDSGSVVLDASDVFMSINGDLA